MSLIKCTVNKKIEIKKKNLFYFSKKMCKKVIAPKRAYIFLEIDFVNLPF